MNLKLLITLIVAAVACTAVYVIVQTQVTLPEQPYVPYAAVVCTASVIGLAYFATGKQQRLPYSSAPTFPREEKKTQAEKDAEKIMDHVRNTIPPIEEAIQETAEKDIGEPITVTEWKGTPKPLKFSEVYKKSKIQVHNAITQRLILDIKNGNIKIKPTRGTLEKLGLKEIQVELEENTQGQTTRRSEEEMFIPSPEELEELKEKKAKKEK